MGQSKSLLYPYLKEVKTIPPKSPIINALKSMVNIGFRRVPVVDPEIQKIMGIITATDLLNFLGGGEKSKIILDKYEGNYFKAINEKVEEVMTRNPICINENGYVEDAIEILIKKNIGGCPIVDDENRVVGMFTERDALTFLILQRKLDGYVKGYANFNLITITPDTSVKEALNVIISKKIRRLPIVENKTIKGVLVTMDFLKYFSKNVFGDLQTGDINEILNKSVREVFIDSPFEIKHRKLLIFKDDDKILDVVKKMIETNKGFALVIKNDRLEGIITERDIVKFIYQMIKGEEDVVKLYF